MNKDVFFLTIPRTLTKNPVPLHLLKHGTIFCKKIIDYEKSSGFYNRSNGG